MQCDADNCDHIFHDRRVLQCEATHSFVDGYQHVWDPYYWIFRLKSQFNSMKLEAEGRRLVERSCFCLFLSVAEYQNLNIYCCGNLRSITLPFFEDILINEVECYGICGRNVALC